MPRTKRAVKEARTPTQNRVHIATLRADGRVACVLYRDPDLQLVAVSIRSPAGITQNPPGIAWDPRIIEKLERLGAGWLEVQIRTTGKCYRAPIETMNIYGRQDSRYQGQVVLTRPVDRPQSTGAHTCFPRNG